MYHFKHMTHCIIYCAFIIVSQISRSDGFGFLVPVGVGLSSALYRPLCYFTECCNERGIPANLTGLQNDLKQHVYGQHLVEDVVINAIRFHWDKDHMPQKALTLSFHGWAGSGKNYVTKFIVNNLYKEGVKSNFVHHFNGRLLFPRKQKVPEYQDNLLKWIKGNVSQCARQLFIFDEVNKMPPTLLDVITPMIDYHEDVGGVDYRHAIFIFLSNTGAELINDKYLELWRDSGRKREDLRMVDFEKMITLGAFNEEGGFYYADGIKSNLIDHYIPFLPMEHSHVRLCILDQFRMRGVDSPREKHVDEAMESVEWGPTNERLFAKNGCKRISQKVGLLVSKYYRTGD